MNIPKLRFPEFKGEWEEKKLNSIFTKITQRNSDNQNSNVITNSATEGLVSQRDYFDKDIANKDKTDNYFIIKNGDFVYNPRKSSAAPYGPFTQYKLLDDGIVSPLYLCLRKNNSEVESKYLENYFKTTCWHQYIYENGSSGARHDRVSIHDDVLLAMPIKVPSLAEQQKIADFLSNVDSIITAETKILNTLQKKKKALMQKLFTRQLRFKSADGTDFPAWEEKKLGEISSSPKYGLNASGIDYDGEHKYLRITDIDEVTHTFSPEEITTPSEFSDDYLLEENDIVFARTGASTGKTYLYNPNDGDLYFAGFLIKFHIKDANARFVFYQTCTHEYEKWVHVMSTRSGQPGINSEEYSTLKIKLPCIEEQQKIADCLSSMDSLIQTQQKVVTTWQQRKKALLQQMFI